MAERRGRRGPISVGGAATPEQELRELEMAQPTEQGAVELTPEVIESAETSEVYEAFASNLEQPDREAAVKVEEVEVLLEQTLPMPLNESAAQPETEHIPTETVESVESSVEKVEKSEKRVESTVESSPETAPKAAVSSVETTVESVEDGKKPGALSYLGTALKKGVLLENPVLRLVLGTCPTLAVTTQASNAIGMGIAATIVLICSNAVISALRRVIPDKVRIPAYITIIAGFVTIVQMLVKAFAPALDESLGIYLPLIVVNCIILGRAEMFASKNKVLPSIVDGLAMGIGFTATLLLMGSIREILGNGSFFGIALPLLSEGELIGPILIFLLPPGGFFVFGMLIALANRLAVKKNLPVRSGGCGSCPVASTCSRASEGGCDK